MGMKQMAAAGRGTDQPNGGAASQITPIATSWPAQSRGMIECDQVPDPSKIWPNPVQLLSARALCEIVKPR